LTCTAAPKRVLTILVRIASTALLVVLVVTGCATDTTLGPADVRSAAEDAHIDGSWSETESASPVEKFTLMTFEGVEGQLLAVAIFKDESTAEEQSDLAATMADMVSGLGDAGIRGKNVTPSTLAHAVRVRNTFVFFDEAPNAFRPKVDAFVKALK